MMPPCLIFGPCTGEYDIFGSIQTWNSGNVNSKAEEFVCAILPKVKLLLSACGQNSLFSFQFIKDILS